MPATTTHKYSWGSWSNFVWPFLEGHLSRTADPCRSLWERLCYDFSHHALLSYEKRKKPNECKTYWRCFALALSGFFPTSLFLMPTEEWISLPYIFLKSTSIFKLKMTKARVWDSTSELLLEWPLGQCAPHHLAAEQQDQLVCLRATFPLSPCPKLFGAGVWAVPALSPSGNNVAQNPLLSRSPIELQGILLPVTLRTMCHAQYLSIPCCFWS